MTTYKELTVWQKAFALTIFFYEASKKFPKEELFVLTAQMRQSAISIVSNIAEGYTRRTTKDYLHFVTIAFGSATEFEVQLLLAKQLGYLTEKQFNELSIQTTEILKMLNRLQSVLKEKVNTNR